MSVVIWITIKRSRKTIEFQQRLKVYKLQCAKKCKTIKYSLFILQSINDLILWSFLYLDVSSKLTSKTSDSTKCI